MRIFLDTNILIDLLEARGEFTQNALKVASMVINNGDELLLSDLSVVNACYIERKSLGNRGFIATFSAIRDCFEIIGMGAPAIDAAITANWNDFEDAMQYFAVLNANADIIVTRNKKDFATSEISVVTPLEYIEGKNK
ncbi:type II toxin-antitoxin system VapC family toxin [Prevotella melaninogenica]